MPSATLPVGTPLWKKPTVKGETSAHLNIDTLVIHPESTDATHTIFEGATCMDGEPVSSLISIRKFGQALARVMGPVAAGDSVGFAAGETHLVKDGTPFAAACIDSIDTAAVKLIMVNIGPKPLAAGSPRAAVVLAVLPNHLVVDLGEGEPTLVQKPWSLHVHALPESDAAVLATFRAGGGTPFPPPNWGYFTQDYLMRGDFFQDRLDSVDLSVYGGDPPAYPSEPWTGGAQSRLRLVHAPMRDLNQPIGGVGFVRFEMREVVWPPYNPISGVGGISGGTWTTLLVQSIPGYGWLDLNVDARHWVDVSVTSGEQIVNVEDASGGGKEIGRVVAESVRF